MHLHEGKRRTREHVLADIGVNYVEGVFLRAGCSVQRIESDYGLDLLVTTYDARGYVEPGWLPVQVKATSRGMRSGKNHLGLSVDARDLHFWLRQLYPVVLILYDGKADAAYWLDVHAYFSQETHTIRSCHTVRIPFRNRLNRGSVRKLRERKAQVVATSEG